jgi:cytoskeletal protein CcmA (bactofilin family)
MFGNKGNEINMPESTASAPTPTRSTNPAKKNAITAYLGPDIRIEGTLHFESSVLIEGEFKGQIISERGQLTIGEKARVEGDLTGGQITIRGHVEGSVTASERVHLADHGELLGELTTPSLQMDESVTFDGSCKMTGGKARKSKPENEKKSEKDTQEDIVDAIHSVS